LPVTKGHLNPGTSKYSPIIISIGDPTFVQRQKPGENKSLAKDWSQQTGELHLFAYSRLLARTRRICESKGGSSEAAPCKWPTARMHSKKNCAENM